jgi:hypothetical protein
MKFRAAGSGPASPLSEVKKVTNMQDPRILVRKLEDQGLKVRASADESGKPKYWITNPDDGMTYGLSWENLDDLHNRGKLSAAGLKQHG